MAQPKFSFLGQLNIDQDVTARLSQNLQMIVDGNSEDFRSPFMKDKSADTIRDEWYKVYSTKASALELKLTQIEESNKDKFGPRSIQKPWKDRYDSLKQYYKSGASKAKDYNYWGDNRDHTRGNLRPLSLDKALRLLKSNTNSGLPYYKKKRLVKERTRDRYHQLIARHDPCVLFTRTQELGKTRNVWGFPMANTLQEMAYYQPFMQRQRQESWRSALNGPIIVDLGLSRLIRQLSSNKELTLVSVDFSAYDASLSESLLTAAFNLVKSQFQQGFAAEIDLIRDNLINIGIVTPEGIWSGSHGMPSGSTFTNEIDSICQYIVSQGCFRDCEIQGDDGVYLTDDVDKLMLSFEDNGLKINHDKSDVSKYHATYLQNYYSPAYTKDGYTVGVYSTFRALNRIVHQERWSNFEDYGITGEDYYSIRAISILENCRHHPLFKDLVKFVVDNDKYGLQYSDKGLSKYVEFISQTSGSHGLISNHLAINFIFSLIRGNSKCVKKVRTLDIEEGKEKK